MKRCQRAGLPIYPSSISDSQPMIKKQRQLPKHQIDDFGLSSMHYNFKPNAMPVSCVPLFPNITFGSPLSHRPGYPINSFFTQSGNPGPSFPYVDEDDNYAVLEVNSLLSSEMIYRPISWELAYNHDRGGGNPASTPLVNYSASQAPVVAAKLELPSLQLPETRFGQPFPDEDVDCYVASPRTASDCATPCNGLLDDVIHGPKTMSSENLKVDAYNTDHVTFDCLVSQLTGSVSSVDESSAEKKSTGEEIELAQHPFHPDI